MAIVYSAVRRFSPDRTGEWQAYVRGSGFTHLKELVSLDGILCPPVIQTLEDEDWQFNVNEDHKTHLFHDLDYLLRRTAGNIDVNVLGVMHEPAAHDLMTFADHRFVFRGFDLVETDGSISALSNCGGFGKAFSTTDLSEYGLLTDHGKALDVQQLLLSNYPDEHHAVCDVWAIWQMAE
jgi:hypothetical protein